MLDGTRAGKQRAGIALPITVCGERRRMPQEGRFLSGDRCLWLVGVFWRVGSYWLSSRSHAGRARFQVEAEHTATGVVVVSHSSR